MTGVSAAVDRLITALGRLPGIGAKSAERLAHHLLKCSPEEALELADAIRAAKQQIRHCQVCFHLTEADQPVCAICRDARRDQATRLRGRAIARSAGAWKRREPSRVFTMSSWAGWLRSRVWAPISSPSTPWKHGSARESSAS